MSNTSRPRQQEASCGQTLYLRTACDCLCLSMLCIGRCMEMCSLDKSMCVFGANFIYLRVHGIRRGQLRRGGYIRPMIWRHRVILFFWVCNLKDLRFMKDTIWLVCRAQYNCWFESHWSIEAMRWKGLYCHQGFLKKCKNAEHMQNWCSLDTLWFS